MGKSNSGKDSILKELLKKTDLVNPLVTYTTRPIRVGEVCGEAYNFISLNEFYNLKSLGKVFESRSYNVSNGDTWIYSTINDEQFLSDKNLITIGTLDSFCEIKKNLSEKFSLIDIYIDVDDEIRYQRALLREKKQNCPDYKELERRFLADNIDFSLERLTGCNVTNIFQNNDFDECVNNILDFIKNKID